MAADAGGGEGGGPDGAGGVTTDSSSCLIISLSSGGKGVMGRGTNGTKARALRSNASSSSENNHPTLKCVSEKKNLVFLKVSDYFTFIR